MRSCNQYAAECEPIYVFDAAPARPTFRPQPRRSAGRTLWLILKWTGLSVGLLFAGLVALVMVLGAYDKQIKIKGGGELTYKPTVKEVEARKLADWLDKNFQADHRVSYQLNKNGGVYEFRMIPESGKENDPRVTALGLWLEDTLSSAVFDGAPVHVIVCDDHFNTIRTIPPLDAPKTADKK